MFNRDEQRARPAAHHPATHRLGPRLALFPVDTPSGGTWIGVNDAGIVAALLNVTPRTTPRAPGRVSRGTIVPSVLEAGALDEALDIAHATDTAHLAPFRLWIADARCGAGVEFDGTALRDEPETEHRDPVMHTTFGRGDHLVQTPRWQAFHQLFAALSPEAAQRRFHEWRDPDDPARGVLMSRSDARTVSLTVIDVHADAAEIRYVTLGDDLRPDRAEHIARLPIAATQATR